MQIKSQFKLTIGLLISVGAVAQASPSFAELYTNAFTTPKGWHYYYDSDNSKLIYSIGDQDTPFSSSGSTTGIRIPGVGLMLEASKKKWSYGTYYQDFPLGGDPTSTPANSTFNYDPANNKISWSQGDFNSPAAKYGEFQYNPNTLRERHIHSIKTADLLGSWIQFGRTTYQVQIPTVDFSYDPKTSITTVYGAFTNSDNKGGYFQQLYIPTDTASTKPDD
jgi:hypothetical protein